MKYENVADSLEAAIADGTYVPGEQLPSIETVLPSSFMRM